MSSSNIPQDLVVEILKRLHVRSLMRLRCVCKTWCALITSNSNFINMHLKSNKTNVDDDPIICVYWDEAAETNIVFLFPIELHDGLPLTLNLEIPSKDIDSPHITFTYGDGVFCIYNHVSCLISLWNPAIREFKTLPHNISPNEDTAIYTSHLGFVLDCKKTNDYKVVVLQHSSDQERRDFRLAQAYNLRTNTWRVVNGGIPWIDGRAGSSPIYTNGFLHWSNMAVFPSVVSFDLSKESFQDTPIPVFPEIADPWFDLALLNGKIAAIYFSNVIISESGSCFEVWVMNDQGINESWIRQYIVKFPEKYLLPLGLWTKGELLFHRDGHLYLYDPTTQKIRDLQLQVSYDACQVGFYLQGKLSAYYGQGPI